MEPEQFSLCWNNFHNNLRTGFHSLLQEEDLVDVTLAAEGRYLKAHKTVLSICSPYFKELFKSNPCKHPIVILQDVKYSSLNCLLQFMYQGEVSVSQDEIPTFMRVAETLKIKGLTENASGDELDTNGIADNKFHRNSPHVYGGVDLNKLKRNRSAKKLMRPIQHLRPLESPKTVKSPPSAPSPHTPPKRPCTEDTLTPYMAKPKQEPVDEEDDDDDFRDLDEHNLDMSSMLESTLSEPSHASGSWTPDFKVPTDTSSPGTLQCILGKRGNPRLIVDGHVFFKKSTYKGGLLFLKSRKGHPVLINDGHIYTLSQKEEDRSTWYCVKRHTLNCEGCLITTTGTGPMLLSYSGHNHAQLNDIIQRLQTFSCAAPSTSA